MNDKYDNEKHYFDGVDDKDEADADNNFKNMTTIYIIEIKKGND